MNTKIQITPAMREFNEQVEHSDFMLDYQFDREPASVLLDRMKQAKCYPESAYALEKAIAGMKMADLDIKLDKRHSGHMAHAKTMKLSKPCSAHDLNFGGECFNCGWKP